MVDKESARWSDGAVTNPLPPGASFYIKARQQSIPAERYVPLEAGDGSGRRAYDHKLQREVVLRMRPRPTDAAIIAELAALAALSHAHVIALYDVLESQDGTMTLVLESAAGLRLPAWLAAAKPDARRILAVFRAVGRGLSAAHGRGLLHRALSPHAIVVGDAGVVKVADFACTLAGDVTSRDESVSAALDQYTFCVVVWEALGGEAPQPERDPKLLRAPSRGVSKKILAALRRGLAEDPERRWPTLQALLAELGDDARSQGIGTALGLGGAIAFGSAVWAGYGRDEACSGAAEHLEGVWDGDRRAAVETAFEATGAPFADRAWSDTARALDEYSAGWSAMFTDACEATTVRAEQSAAVMDQRMTCLRRATVDLAAIVSELARADAAVVERAQRLTGALPPLSRCADVDALQAEVEPPLPHEAEAVEGIRAAFAEARAASDAGRYERASEAVGRAKLGVETIAYEPVRTELALAEGSVSIDLGAYEAAADAYRRALRLGARQRQWIEARSAAQGLVFVVGALQHRPREGLAYTELARGLAHGDPLRLADVYESVGGALEAAGRNPEAVQEYRRALPLREGALGPDHPSNVPLWQSLANALYSMGQYDEAQVLYRRSLALRERTVGPDHPDLAKSITDLGNVFHAQGKFADAEAMDRRALALWERTLGADHPLIAKGRHNIASSLFSQGKYAEAEAEYRLALAARIRALGPEHPDVALWDPLESTCRHASLSIL